MDSRSKLPNSVTGTLRNESAQARFDNSLPSLSRADELSSSRAVPSLNGSCEPNNSVYQPQLKNVKVLVADDSPDNQSLFARMLGIAGAVVEVAENGAEALRMCQTRSYDAIVMDIRMPVMDGYQATLKIREEGYSGPIIALTAHAVPGEEARCRAAGCSHFLTKPVSRRDFIEMLRSACCA